MATASPQPPPSSTISNSKVSQETISKAVSALLKWKDTQSNSQKPQLLPQEDFVYLIVTLKKIPSNGGRTNPFKFPLPHPLHSSSSEICLIIDDRPKSNLTSDIAKKKIKNEEIRVSKVLKLSKLKTDYKPFQKKRQLCDSYDLFFADKRVIPLLPKLLGKEFFKKKKLPLGVNLEHKNWKRQIEVGCSVGLLWMREGTCCVVKVGKVSMESGEIVENVHAAIDGLVEFVPKKWGGLRSLHLKVSESLALPIYQSLPDVKLKIEGLKNSVDEVGDEKLEVKEEAKKDGKLGRKKGRIHEVRYMDVSVDEDELGVEKVEDVNESDKNEDIDLGSGESVGKKRKKRHSAKGKVLGDLNGDRKAKRKMEKRQNDDVGSVGIVGKKKKKDVVESKNNEKRPSKMDKKEALKSVTLEAKVKKSKKKSAA